MRKRNILCLALIATVFLVLCFASCNKLPADHISGTDVVIDNETPFIYDESTVKYHQSNYSTEKVSVSGYVENYFGAELTYREIASLFGNKILRHYINGEEEVYYTVYSLPNNNLYYLFLRRNGSEYYPIRNGKWFSGEYDARDDITGYVYEHDTPFSILGGKLPDYCYLEYYSPEDLANKNFIEWQNYVEYCERAGSAAIPYLSNHYTELREQVRHQDVECIIRCLQHMSFDIITEQGGAIHGVYFYDIYIYKDGTATLLFYHYELTFPFYTLIQTEKIQLSATEGKALTELLNEWDVNNIPTWNPENYIAGNDGEGTYILINGTGYNNKLITMWESTERHGIYHIRKAIEELVRSHITVTDGCVYNRS